ncbi:proteasome activator subunit 4-like [Camellia sinensis]|uniref:proteasome activator subunit 4-like n=1 Tax=Camellia sinensis TaxID=4442 RepID=UPI0010364CCC|nr:proteasome activator subunit 4-like [Camellia sinensis]
MPCSSSTGVTILRSCLKELCSYFEVWHLCYIENVKVQLLYSTNIIYIVISFHSRHTFILSTVEKKQIWSTVEKHLTDNQVEVREHAAAVLAGLMKGGDENLAEDFRGRAYRDANAIQPWSKRTCCSSFSMPNEGNSSSGLSIASIHGAVLALAACVLSVPYDMPSWLPEHVTLLAHFVGESSPAKSTVTKAVAEFQRTHADTWNIQKNSFTEDQLEVLADTSSSSSYFA